MLTKHPGPVQPLDDEPKTLRDKVRQLRDSEEETLRAAEDKRYHTIYHDCQAYVAEVLDCGLPTAVEVAVNANEATFAIDGWNFLYRRVERRLAHDEHELYLDRGDGHTKINSLNDLKEFLDD